MKFAIALNLTLLLASTAQADGLICVGEQTATHFQVYNHTEAASGTRNPAILIVSSPFVKVPNKTIAKFYAAAAGNDASQQNLFYRGHGMYEVQIDTAKNKTLRGGENIAGTKLAQLQKIVIDTHFSYSIPVKKGAAVLGVIYYTKRTGEVLSEKADCTRYLKQ